MLAGQVIFLPIAHTIYVRTFIDIVPCYCLHIYRYCTLLLPAQQNNNKMAGIVLLHHAAANLHSIRTIAQGEIRSQCMWTNIPRSGKRYAVFFLGGGIQSSEPTYMKPKRHKARGSALIGVLSCLAGKEGRKGQYLNCDGNWRGHALLKI